MKAIYKNELRSYFTSMTGYVFVGFMLLFAGIYTLALCLRSGFPSFEYVLANMSFVFFIIVPVITMKVLSEEKRQKTDQLLYSLPITTTDVVLGKYFALLTVLAVPLLIMAFYPLILSLYGNVYLLTAYGALLGFFFMGAAFLAIGLFISSVTESQMIAAGLCFVVLLLNYFITQISGEPVIGMAPLRNMLLNMNTEQTVKITVLRRSNSSYQSLDFDIHLERR